MITFDFFILYTDTDTFLYENNLKCHCANRPNH